MPAPTSTAELIDLVRKSGLYEGDTFDNRLGSLPALPDQAAPTAILLVKHGIITKFQAKLLMMGKYRGFRIGPYTIKEQIGQGGMGAVYLAEHMTLRRKVALKVLTPGPDSDQKVAVERFMREARAAAALDHPNIVRLHDVGQFGVSHYLVMEYVEGVTLDNLVAKGKTVPCGKAIDYIAQAAAGLQHAYEKGFVHRDIKPSNLMLSMDGTVKILDMGLARSSDERDKLTANIDIGAIIGTADFISPEQAVNDPKVDIRADIYSLGATFFSLVTGKPPFAGNTTQKLVQHQVKEAPSMTGLDKTLPKELDEIVQKMMAKKKENRYQTPADVIEALTPWLPNNAKVMAGLTQTEFGLSSQETMDQLVKSNTKSLTKTNRKPEPFSISRILKWNEGNNKFYYLLGGIALSIVLLGTLIGWMLFGGSGGDQAKSGVEHTWNPPGNQAAPGPIGKPDGTSNPASGRPVAKPNVFDETKAYESIIAHPKSLYSLSFEGMMPGTRQILKQSQRGKPNEIGAQILPNTVMLNQYDQNTSGEYTLASLDGAMALGMRVIDGNGGTQLNLSFEDDSPIAPGQMIIARITYQLRGEGQGFAAFELTREPYTKLRQISLPSTGSKWTSVEIPIIRPETKATRISLVINPGFRSNPDKIIGSLWIKSVQILGQGSTETSSAAPAPPAAKFDSKSTIYEAKMADWMPGRFILEGQSVTAGVKPTLPDGVMIHCWNAKSVGQFSIADTGAGQSLAMTNLNDTVSCQLLFLVEKELNLKLTSGKKYTVRIDYRTKNEGGGVALVQNADYAPVEQVLLDSTSGNWSTKDLTWTSQAGKPVSIAINSTGIGEGNSLEIRKVTIFEVP
ncbi:MAG: serine/threonine-protein kinase [Gemmataceae bacterium]